MFNKIKILFLFFVLSVSITLAQDKSFIGSYCDLDFGTIANSVSETKYVVLPNWAKLDSVVVVAYGTGEIDVDSIDIYVGHGNGVYGSTAYTATVTLDLAAAAVGWQQCVLASTGGTPLTGAALRGAEKLKVITRGATAGCDATDPNNFHVLLRAYGTK